MNFAEPVFVCKELVELFEVGPAQPYSLPVQERRERGLVDLREARRTICAWGRPRQRETREVLDRAGEHPFDHGQEMHPHLGTEQASLGVRRVFAPPLAFLEE